MPLPPLDGHENHCTGNGAGGSNPSPSARRASCSAATVVRLQTRSPGRIVVEPRLRIVLVAIGKRDVLIRRHRPTAGLANFAASIATFGCTSLSSIFDRPFSHVTVQRKGILTPETSR